MSFKDIEIKDTYRSFQEDVIQNFYIPVLKESVQYDRAVGYFSSSAFLSIYPGILGLVKNGGKIRLIFSPNISLEDTEAISKGLKLQESQIETLLIDQLSLPDECDAENRLDILTNLIALNILDIRIITMENSKGIFHSKIAILTDLDGNRLCFTGSANETESAFRNNVEEYDVYLPWDTNSLKRINNKAEQFEKWWNDEVPGQKIHRFPKLEDALIEKFRKTKHTKESLCKIIETEANKKCCSFPCIPYDISLREYQIEAINNWAENNYVGIFDMATGTGKTYTALAAVCNLYNKLQKLAIVIICPYQHLVEQWAEDVRKFNLEPLLCYSAHKWKSELPKKRLFFNNDIINNFCIITTNATFRTKAFQSELELIRNGVFIVDEAHNMGAINLSALLPDHFQYRLALSATIERYQDEEGTQALFDYFKKKVISFTLEEAIRKNMLTKYKYYPIPISLTEDEREYYSKLTKKLTNYINIKGNSIHDKDAQMILIERSRIIAGAKEKLKYLKEYMQPYKSKNHILVYCGASRIRDFTDIDDSDIRQIDEVCKILGTELDIRTMKYTSSESISEREDIKTAFENKLCQALVAIKCLDEGVNIPSIETVFLLASSTNPKEYIQRRGRVLRKYPGKEYAVIYDFITLPYPIPDDDSNINYRSIGYDSLVTNELNRIEEFSSSAINSHDSYDIARRIRFFFLSYICKFEGESTNATKH